MAGPGAGAEPGAEPRAGRLHPRSQRGRSRSAGVRLRAAAGGDGCGGALQAACGARRGRIPAPSARTCSGVAEGPSWEAASSGIPLEGQPEERRELWGAKLWAAHEFGVIFSGGTGRPPLGTWLLG